MTPTMRFLKPTARLLAALLPLAPASLVAQGASAAGARGTFAFVDVSVIPMTGTGPQVLPNRTVIVRDGLITQVGAAGALAPPSGATVIQGRGKYLMPGLAEMHAHLPAANAPAQLAHDILFLYVDFPVLLQIRLVQQTQERGGTYFRGHPGLYRPGNFQGLGPRDVDD